VQAAADGAGGGAPQLRLDGFVGPLDHLLAQARARQVDLAVLPLTDLIGQLITALQQAPATIPLGQKADWVVMAAWLLQLRARLLLPADALTQPGAEVEAQQLRDHLTRRQEAQALTDWLERRPRLGYDSFARGRPEALDVALEPAAGLDVVAFLWASLALFDDDLPPVPTTPTYRPRWLDLHRVADARARILQRLSTAPDGQTLASLLPAAAAEDTSNPLRRRSGWASTFVASLDLAKDGAVALAQDGDFAAIIVRPRQAGGPRHSEGTPLRRR
jgi:segregation and condensation protein A